MKRSLLLPLFSLLAMPLCEAQFLGPSPYLSAADSPFSGTSFSYFHLENFEDGLFNVLGATATAGWTPIQNPFSDSVDADDGAINGTGANAWSFLSGGTSLTITFNAAALGGLPTHAGIVWTDVGTTSGVPGFGPVTFTATNALGQSLGGIGPFTLGDGAVNGGTAEDRFFGVINSGGISSITISMANSSDWEVDHLQFGRAIPEPSSIALATLGVITLAGRMASKRRA